MIAAIITGDHSYTTTPTPTKMRRHNDDDDNDNDNDNKIDCRARNAQARIDGCLTALHVLLTPRDTFLYLLLLYDKNNTMEYTVMCDPCAVRKLFRHVRILVSPPKNGGKPDGTNTPAQCGRTRTATDISIIYES